MKILCSFQDLIGGTGAVKQHEKYGNVVYGYSHNEDLKLSLFQPNSSTSKPKIYRMDVCSSESLVQIAGTKKANGMHRNLPKSLQKSSILLAKNLIKGQTFAGMIFQDCLTP